MGLPRRETARLRFGRLSAPGAHYFITVCTKDRSPMLTKCDNGNRVIEIIKSMHDSGDMDVYAATLMPDHLHLLMTLGHRLRVG